jgi:hypothetical protein
MDDNENELLIQAYNAGYIKHALFVRDSLFWLRISLILGLIGWIVLLVVIW